MSYNMPSTASGAGKSVLAKTGAKAGIQIRRHRRYIPLGGYYMYEHGIDVSDASAVEDALENDRYTARLFMRGQQVLVNGVDYGDKIRLPEISMYASAVAAIPAVRKKLLGRAARGREKITIQSWTGGT